jgi:organic hydroperoxide reductase OsmC/OhrA
MTISATIKNSSTQNAVTVSTNSNRKDINIPGKPEGGSSVNGGELLFLSLATCFCNGIYREATKRKITILSVEVSVSGEFGKEGEPGKNITYEANVQAPDHSQQEIAALISYVDQIAEIHNTLRKGVGVSLKRKSPG